MREQLEHDRVIRLLQAKYKRKFDVAINPGNEQTAPVGTGTPWYPDLVLQERGRKLVGVVEVETAESVNNLEAMSQWVAFGRLRAQFHLYVPASAIDTTRRLCADLGISVAEIWAYHTIGDQLRFTLVQKTGPGLPKGSPEPRSSVPKVAVNGSSARASEKAAAPKPAASKPAAPVKKAAPAKAAPAKTAPARVAPAKPAPVAKKAVAVKKAVPAPKKTAKPAVVAKTSNGKKKAAPPAKSAKRR